MVHNMHLVGHRAVPHQAELQHGLPPALDHLLVVGRQLRLADHPVEVAVRQQGALVVGKLLGDSELLHICQNLGNTLITTYALCTVHGALHSA